MSPFAPYPLLHAGASISLTSFTVHWSTVIGLVGLAVLYEWAARRTAESGRGSSTVAHSAFPISHFRPFFYAGLLVIFLSLNGWLHDLSDYYLFSAHMVQ